MSFGWPQSLPASTLIILSFSDAFVAIVWTWSWKEVGVEGYPEDFGVTFEGKGGVSKGDGRVEMGLVGVGSEEGDVGLGG